ncbi:MAG TPA: TOMM precursor leader peptide-binding protein [Pyrinomonadaceae bacterium]|jgi:bacteriocin biosynthesis cyclodehydratase domain-containing protein
MKRTGFVLILQASWRYYPTADSLELVSAMKGARILLKGPAPEKLAQMLDALAAGIPVTNARREVMKFSGLNRAAAGKLLKDLFRRGAIVFRKAELTSTDANGVYDRQVRFFNAFETSELTGIDFNKQLQDRQVVIVGLGGYGTWLALLCARTGISKIVGIDPDRVESSNLNRQVLYSHQDIGRLKIDACKAALAHVNKEVTFEGHAKWIRSVDDLRPQLESADLVFNSFGYLPANGRLGEHIARAALRARVPSLVFSGSWIGPLTVPGQTACYWCAKSRLEDNAEVTSVIKASTLSQPTRFVPSFAPRMAASASLAVWEASRFLAGLEPPPSLRGLITLDLFSYNKHRFIAIDIDPDCRECGKTSA